MGMGTAMQIPDTRTTSTRPARTAQQLCRSQCKWAGCKGGHALYWWLAVALSLSKRTAMCSAGEQRKSPSGEAGRRA